MKDARTTKKMTAKERYSRMSRLRRVGAVLWTAAMLAGAGAGVYALAVLGNWFHAVTVVGYVFLAWLPWVWEED